MQLGKTAGTRCFEKCSQHFHGKVFAVGYSLKTIGQTAVSECSQSGEIMFKEWLNSVPLATANLLQQHRN
jgi:hypothetical protein